MSRSSPKPPPPDYAAMWKAYSTDVSKLNADTRRMNLRSSVGRRGGTSDIADPFYEEQLKKIQEGEAYRTLYKKYQKWQSAFQTVANYGSNDGDTTRSGRTPQEVDVANYRGSRPGITPSDVPKVTSPNVVGVSGRGVGVLGEYVQAKNLIAAAPNLKQGATFDEWGQALYGVGTDGISEAVSSNTLSARRRGGAASGTVTGNLWVQKHSAWT